ncbi:MAG: pyridoxamine 5'-phosphate oxidase [Pseudomonadota bacterium]|nr:pyridoxamine 5'-phosphate oxidase [Pseudomonadota bacterium]
MFEPQTDDPIVQFDSWFADAQANENNDPNAMTVATADAKGRPSARILLLKGHDADGFVFYTNLDSRKGGELRANPFVSLCFHWKSLARQVRVEGPVAPVDDAEADAYFASRARGSQIGAWASQQSHPIADRAALMQSVAEVEARFADRPVPRPPHWSGVRLTPLRMEFWHDGEFRLHDRFVFSRAYAGSAWACQRLSP